jgi:D-sedoheptulose 7-phosphate isomerase
MTSILDKASSLRVEPGLALAADADRVARACHDMAVRFQCGGRLLTFGNGGSAADAGHLAVEFLHPVIVGKRALPAISLNNDAATLSGVAQNSGYGAAFATQLRLMGRPADIAVGILTDPCGNVTAALAEARGLGMLTIALTREGGTDLPVDHLLTARTDDPRIAREIHVTMYHILWELVHVFFEHPPVPTDPGRRNRGDTLERRARVGPPLCQDDADALKRQEDISTPKHRNGADAPEPRDDAGTPGPLEDSGMPECHGDVCVTCADEAVPVRIIGLLPEDLAVVDTGNGNEEISVALVEATVGDVVLVHAKEALAVLEADATTGAGRRVKADSTALYPFLSGDGSVVDPFLPGDRRALDPIPPTDRGAVDPSFPTDRGAVGPSGGGHVEAVVAEVTRSTAEKAREIVALRREVLDVLGPRVTACAEAIAAAFQTGGRLFAFGNGGSSTDAQALAQLFVSPGNGGRGLPATALTADVALLTALTNDVGFEVVFSRQLAALGAGGDIAVGMSTSGGSPNVLRGLEEARRRRMVTVGFAGTGGGAMAESGVVDHLFVVPSSSVHRIQEAQTTICHVLWELVQRALA